MKEELENPWKARLETLGEEELENQWKAILEILGEDDSEMVGGLIYTDITIDQFDSIQEKAPLFVQEGGHNGSPTTEEFVKFCRTNPQFIMEIYAVTPERSDYRIDIVGVKAPDTIENKNILYKWTNEVITENNIRDIIEPTELGEYGGFIRAWWD